MAKISGALLSFGAAGTIGKTVTFARWKGQPYARQRVVPSNPNSTAQQLTRGVFANGSNVWKNAGALLIAPWNSFALGQTLTGRNAFMSKFVSLNRGEADLQSMQFSPGAKGGVPLVSATPTAGDDQVTVVCVPPTPPTGWTVNSCVVAVIPDQDPETMTDYISSELDDSSDPYSINITGLLDATNYVGGAWPVWNKPDGSLAYGPSSEFTFLTT